MRLTFVFFLVSVSFLQSTYCQLPLDPAGWTILNPSADSRLVYLSPSQGNDSTARYYLPNDTSVGADPFNPAGAIQPYKSITAATALLRSGYADWLLIKRGDTLLGSISLRSRVGRSDTERIVLTAYGTGQRPVIIPPANSNGIYLYRGTANIALQGLEVCGGDTGNLNIGVFLYPTPDSTRNFLMEDCYVNSFLANVVFETSDTSVPYIKNTSVRRCIIANAYPPTGITRHAEGCFIDQVDSLLIEECVFDHNGWKQPDRSDATIFNHNMYITTGNTGNSIVRNNIITRGSSHGLQLRHGGLIQNNLLVQNAIMIQLGAGDPDPLSHKYGVTGSVINNVMLEAVDINNTTPRGWGIVTADIGHLGALLQYNITAHSNVPNSVNSTSLLCGADSYGYGVGYNSVVARDNIFYDWQGGISFSDTLTTPPSPSTFNSANGNVFEHNDVQVPVNSYSNGGYAASVFFASTPQNIIFRNNRYWGSHTGDSLHQFAYITSNTPISFNQWQTSTGDSGSVVQRIVYPDASRSVEEYDSLLGGAGTFESFITACRSQSKAHWDKRYTADEVNCYIRQGFARLVTFTASADTVTACAYSTIQLSLANINIAEYGVSWNGGRFSKQDSFTFTPPDTGTYTITAQVLDSAYGWLNCSPAVKNFTIKAARCLGITELSGPSLTIKPNPAIKGFGFQLTGVNNSAVLSVWNPAGQRVYSNTYRAHNGLVSDWIDAGNLAPGIYYLQVISGENSVTKRVVLQ